MEKLPKIFQDVEKKILEITDEKSLMIEASFALQHINSNKRLQSSTQESKQKALLNCFQVGLTLNPVAKEAYLVPRTVNIKEGNEWKSKIECCLEPSYVGLVKLLTDAGSVQNINTQIVYENDDFDIDLGSCEVKHKPHFLKKKEKGNIVGVYSVAILSTSNKQIEFMTYQDIEEIKNRSESFKAYKDKKIKSCIWVSDETEMIRKTIIRRIYKYLPRTEKMQRIDRAVDLDTQDYKISYSQMGYIEALLEKCELPESEKISIGDEVNVMSSKRAGEVIEYLRQNTSPTLEQQFDNKISE